MVLETLIGWSKYHRKRTTSFIWRRTQTKGTQNCLNEKTDLQVLIQASGKHPQNGCFMTSTTPLSHCACCMHTAMDAVFLRAENCCFLETLSHCTCIFIPISGRLCPDPKFRMSPEYFFLSSLLKPEHGFPIVIIVVAAVGVRAEGAGFTVKKNKKVTSTRGSFTDEAPINVKHSLSGRWTGRHCFLRISFWKRRGTNIKQHALSGARDTLHRPRSWWFAMTIHAICWSVRVENQRILQKCPGNVLVFSEYEKKMSWFNPLTKSNQQISGPSDQKQGSFAWWCEADSLVIVEKSAQGRVFKVTVQNKNTCLDRKFTRLKIVSGWRGSYTKDVECSARAKINNTTTINLQALFLFSLPLQTLEPTPVFGRQEVLAGVCARILDTDCVAVSHVEGRLTHIRLVVAVGRLAFLATVILRCRLSQHNTTLSVVT